MADPDLQAQFIEVDASMVEQRLDRWLKARFEGLSQGRINKLIRKGQIRLDRGRVKSNARFAHVGQVLRLPPKHRLFEESRSHPQTVNDGVVETKEASAAGPWDRKNSKTATKSPKLSPQDQEAIKAMILHQDDNFIVLNKPAGLAVQGGSKQKRHLDGLLRAYFADQAEPKLVHRLDRATSGLLLVALHAIAAKRLAAAFHDDLCQKTYWALATGNPPDQFDLEAPLLKTGSQGYERMQVNQDGVYARTKGLCLARGQQGAGSQNTEALSLMELSPITGRTHQLRVHMAHLEAPLWGDPKYGGPKAPFLGLHAKSIEVPDPATGLMRRFDAPLPALFSTKLKNMGFEPSHSKPQPFDPSKASRPV